MRLLEPEEDHSFLKLFLFICMVVVGVMILNNGSGSNIALDKHRSLMQTYNLPETTPLLEEDELSNKKDIDVKGKCHVESHGLVEISGGINNEMCL